MENKETPILANKPYFELNMNVIGSIIDVRLNGISIYSALEKSKVNLSVPVNQWMKSGINDLQLLLVPYPDEDALRDNIEHKVILTVRSFGEKKIRKYEVATLAYYGRLEKAGAGISMSTQEGNYNSERDFYPDTNGDVKISRVRKEVDSDYPRSLLLTMQIDLPVELPNWKMWDSDTLPDIGKLSDDEYFSLRNSLFKEYHKIQTAIRSGNVDNVVAMAGERNRELDLAFYYETGTTEQKLRMALADIAADKNAKLENVTAETMQLEQMPNRKLIQGIISSGHSPIVFDFIDGIGSESYDMIFRRENGKWILTR